MLIPRPRLLIPLGLLGSLAACATPTIPPTVDAVGMPNAELALRRSMDQVNADMGELGTLRTHTGSSPAGEGGVLSVELQKQIAFQWSGPLDAGVRKLGKTLGYQVSVYGPADQQPLPVAIDLAGQALDILRALGEQAGTRATVSVDPLHHQIAVTHHV
ncbi:MAG: DotD/TraH family lipoprotein [Janthinobacterium lividum]